MANQKEEDADDIIVNENKTAHWIETFNGNIDQLSEGTYEWDEDKQEWTCTNCQNKKD